MNKENQDPGILIHGISLIDSSFHREAIQNPNFEDNLNLQLDMNIRDDKLHALVFLTAKLDRINKETSNIEAKAEVKYLGIFSKSETSQMDMEQFCKVNAPAMLYPYIRNYIHEVFQKASLTPVLLPPINIHKTFNNNIIPE